MSTIIVCDIANKIKTTLGANKMKLQSLKYFVSLAGTKSYTKSAEECFITQPALSRSISELENKLGCRLFIRNSRFVDLTDEGEVCLAEAKKILKHCDMLIEKVTNTSQQFKNPVKIGYVIYGHLALFNKKLGQIPNSNIIKIETEYDSLAKTIEKLMSDEIDMAIVPEASKTNFNNINAFKLQNSQLYVLVPNKNNLFHNTFVDFNDLKNQKFIGWCPNETPIINDSHSAVCERNGFKPEFVAYGKKMGDIMTLSILHNALGFASCKLTVVDSEEFKLIPVSDSEESFGLLCIWKKNHKNPSINKLIQLLEE
jgi:DNA-binding transcriptional LysR family regulator